MWDFLTWIVGKLTDEIGIKLTSILSLQQQILSNQEELRVILMGAVEKLAEFATKVNDLTNQEAANLTAIVAAIEALKAKLVAAASEAEVDAALSPVLAQITAVADNLNAVAVNNQPTVPPPTPPIEEPL